MKRFLSGVLAALMLCGMLAGCGEQEKTDKADVAIYPAQIEDFANISEFQQPPSTVFATPASENGLGDTLYKFEGEVIRVVPKEVSQSKLGFFVLKSEQGEMAIADPFDTIMKADVDDILLDETELRRYFELPDVGENVCVYAEYLGYSEACHIAMSLIGGQDYIANVCAELGETALDNQDDDSSEYLPQESNVQSTGSESGTTLLDLSDSLNSCVGDDEYITSVTLNDKVLKIVVDLSHADSGYLSIDDLAYSRASSITDEILDHSDFDSKWDTIIIDLGAIGSIQVGKSAIRTNEYDMRHMDSSQFQLK